MLASSKALCSLQPLTGMSNVLSRRLETDEDRVRPRDGSCQARVVLAASPVRRTGVMLIPAQRSPEAGKKRQKTQHEHQDQVGGESGAFLRGRRVPSPYGTARGPHWRAPPQCEDGSGPVLEHAVYSWGETCSTPMMGDRRGRIAPSRHPEASNIAPVPSSLHKHHGRVITYTLPGGWQVLVGRTDAENDSLSFRVARPEDWWFHVRGRFCRKVRFLGKIQKSGVRNSMTYRLPNARKSNCATEPSQ